MAREVAEAQIQLATRIPKELRRRLKLHCVTSDVSVMEFVAKAIADKLGRDAAATDAWRVSLVKAPR